MSAAISARGVVVHAGGRTILGPLTFEVEEGEHALVVGPSGSGKTTLLRAIAGLSPLAEGTLEILGRRAAEGSRALVPPRARELGFLFQGGALWPHMTVRKTLAFVLRERGVPRPSRASRIAELVRKVGLEGFEDRRPGTLSGGEKQRLALARALAADPRILLLDEPLGPLDSDRRRNLLEMLNALRSELALTILHVTHDPGEAAAFADCTLTLNAGLLVAEGVA